MDRCLMRLLCTFLAVLLVCQESFAGVEGATASDAAPVYVDGSGGGSAGAGLLARASEEELEQYYQSFVDYPVTLLEWPEGVPQPRFAAAALGAAAIWVLKVLLVSVGIYAGVEITKEVWSLLQNYETYLRMLGDAMLLDSWEAILKAQWGMAVTGMALQYGKLKQFMREEVQGYGTGAPEYTISGTGNPITEPGKYFSGYSGSETISDITSPVYVYFLYRAMDSGGYGASVMFISAGNFKSSYYTFSLGDYYYCSSTFLSGQATVDYYLSNPYVIPISGMSLEDFKRSVESPGFVLGSVEPVVVTPDKTWADVQGKDFADADDTVYIPVGQAAADEIEANVAAAAGAADVSKALEKTWDLGQLKEGAGVDEDTYPWIPSITRWLEGIKSGIDSIKEKVMSIPDTLAKILDGILAIPGQIADFFTLDTAVVSNEFASLQDVFAAKFAGISLLADVFTKSYSFDMAVPVFTVPVPETLRELFGGQPEIVIMDLRPHTELFLQLRSLLVAMFWVAFAKWLLDQFDVKFHVG